MKKQNKKAAKQPSLGKYNHIKIEKEIQKLWAKEKIFKTAEDHKKEKFYVLDMFPYPSGLGLHVGHPKGYIATDIVSRYKRMNGFSVLHPMGFDAFGLPAENYAIKTKTNPDISVKKNVATFKKQLEILGLDYDWSREINTTDPNFYKWTQWIFLQMFKKGLAYESNEPINWCPSCKTGLANEDVENGRCERCGTLVEKKPMRQWVLRITKYADRLLEDLDAVKDGFSLNWPQSIKEAQRNWIGKSEGASIKFKIELDPELKGKLNLSKNEIEVFTTRPDTIFGVTYVVLAPEHSVVNEVMNVVSNKNDISKYVIYAKNATTIDRTDVKKQKTGIPLKGIYATNPANGDKVPVWVSDYVLGDYGTGAVMAVPAHDERDWEFARKFNLPIKQVIMPHRIDKKNTPIPGKRSETRRTVHALIIDPKTKKILCLKWKKFPWTGFVVGGVDDGEDIVSAAHREAHEETGYKNLKHIKSYEMKVQGEYYAAHKDVNRVAIASSVLFELENEERDPIEAYELEKHEPIWLDPKTINEDNFTCAELDLWLKWIDGDNDAYEGDGLLINSGKFDAKNSGLIKKEITKEVGGEWVTRYKLRDWVFSRQRYWGEPIPLIHCERCGVVAVPEKDLPVKLPKVKSYEPTGTGESPLATIKKWVNVKCPKCKGPAKRETNTMPQWAGSSWYYLRYEDPKNKKALVDKKIEKYWAPVDLYVGGAEHATRHLIYSRFWHKFLHDIGIVNTSEPFKKLQYVGLIMGEDGRKMSKRFNNVVNPDDMVKHFGADTLRVFEMFMGPFDQQINWSTANTIGSRRFLERVWTMSSKIKEGSNKAPISETINRCIKKVSEDIGELRLNTAISAMMITVNEMDKDQFVSRTDYEALLKQLAPFAPHMTDKIWRSLGNKKSIHISAWPKYDPIMKNTAKLTIVVQVNGKTRGTFQITEDEANEENLKKIALEMDEVKKWVREGAPQKIIVVPKRLVNVVVN